MTTVLMCRPDFYGIEYEINPWMRRQRPADQCRAASQWHALHQALTTLGVRVELVAPVAGLPDLVFTANAGLVHDGVAVLSNFRYPQRAGEQPVFRAWFESRGLRVVELPPSLCFEGAGDSFIVGDRLFAGYPFRGDRAAHACIGRLVDKEPVSVELVDPCFYHLDTCFAPLNDDVALYYPEAFSSTSRELLQRHFPDLIAVSSAEARRFACNVVVIGNTVVFNRGCPETEARLAERGYRCLPIPTSEFIKAGGSAKCLTLIIND